MKNDRKILFMLLVMAIIMTIIFVHQQKKITSLANEVGNLNEKANQSGLAAEVSRTIIGEGQLSALDKDVLKRIEDIESLDSDTKNHLFFLIDNVIHNFKTKKAFG